MRYAVGHPVPHVLAVALVTTALAAPDAFAPSHREPATPPSRTSPQCWEPALYELLRLPPHAASALHIPEVPHSAFAAARMPATATRRHPASPPDARVALVAGLKPSHAAPRRRRHRAPTAAGATPRPSHACH